MKREDHYQRVIKENYGSEDRLIEIIERDGLVFDSLCECHCINPGCQHSEELEQDQRRGYCEECKDNSLVSIMIMIGVM